MSRPKFNAYIDIESDVLHSVAYDPKTEILDVKLKTTPQLYRYRGVTAEDFAYLVTAKSAGKAFSQRIKSDRKATKLRRTSLYR